jgi:hypothetical protein
MTSIVSNLILFESICKGPTITISSPINASILYSRAGPMASAVNVLGSYLSEAVLRRVFFNCCQENILVTGVPGTKMFFADCATNVILPGPPLVCFPGMMFMAKINGTGILTAIITIKRVVNRNPVIFNFRCLCIGCFESIVYYCLGK